MEFTFNSPQTKYNEMDDLIHSFQKIKIISINKIKTNDKNYLDYIDMLESIIKFETKLEINSVPISCLVYSDNLNNEIIKKYSDSIC